MSFEGVLINKSQNGLTKGESADRVCVLVIGATEVAGKLSHYKPVELLQIEDLEDLGVTEATDEAQGELLYYHASEAFRLAPESVFHLITVPKTEKVSTLAVSDELKQAIRSIAGANTIGVAGVAADETLQAAVAAAQLLVDGFTDEHIYLDAILLEGVGGYLKESVAAFDDLRAMESPNVTVVIAQDPDVAARKEAFAGYAAVGSAMGMLAVRAVHENMGSVDVESKPRKRKGEQDYSLTDSKTGKWLNAALSNGTMFNALTGADQKKLNGLGYVYAGMFAGYGGFFFSNSHTATNAGSDYAFIERNAVWNKAARIIRETLIPRVRSKVQADPSTGYIKSTTIQDWDGRIRKALEPMVAVGNMADFDIYINPKQLAVSNAPFNVQVRMVADGVVHEFEIDLGFTNKI